MRHGTTSSSRGFTLVELTVVIAVVCTMAMLIAFVLQRTRSRLVAGYDVEALRRIQQSCALWSQSNGGQFPLPSQLDAQDRTIAGITPEEKDTTGNIVSILLYHGYFSPDLCVSVREASPSIRPDTDYQFTAPQTAAAADKQLALWDPAFSTDYSNGRIGNFSFAMVLPGGRTRRALWSSTFDATQAIVSNRAPELTATTKAVPPQVTASTPASSNTYSMHGPRGAWHGYVVYNDGHSAFEKNMLTSTNQGPLTYTDGAGVKWNDLLFFDEPDDATGTNNYLGNFVKAGKEPADFTAIWD